MSTKLTNNELNSMKKTCDKIVDKVSNVVGNNPDLQNLEVTTTYDIADYAVRMTLAYLMRYGLINKDLFTSFGDLTDEDMDYINKELEKNDN